MSYFTTDEFRQLMPDMKNEPAYPDELVELARDSIEALIEQLAGTSFITRTITETVDGSPYGIVLKSAYPVAITSVTIDGVLETGYTYTFTNGVLERNITGSYLPTSWVTGRRNITVVYTAGYSTAPPADLKLAAMEAVRDKVMRLKENSGAASSRATSISNEMGGTTQFLVASSDHPTGLPHVDATIMRWVDYVRVPSIA